MDLISPVKLLGIAAAVAPFILMTLRSGKINLERKYRGHQFLLPIIAVAYCIIMMVATNSISIRIVKWTRFLSGIASFVPFAGGILKTALNVLTGHFSIGYGIQLAANTIIMTGFCILKRFLLPIIKKWWSNWRGLYNHTAGMFYTTKGDKTILSDKYANMRVYFNVMYYVAVVIGCLDCLLSLIITDSSAFQFPFYPVFGIIVLGEICFFLNGETQDEMNKADKKEKGNHEGEAECEQVMRKEEKTFSDRVLLADIVTSSLVNEKEHYWTEELPPKDSIDQIAAAYFDSLSKSGFDINADYVTATRNLLHGKSVLVLNPFYRDITEYIMLPVFHELLNHKRVLVVCGRAMNESDVVEWIRDGISDITNLPKLWKVDSLGDFTNGTNTLNIGILGFRKLYDLRNLTANNSFFKDVSFVIILEPSNLLGTGQIGLRTLVQLCEGNKKTVTYLAVDRNADGLVDALSHIVRQPITEVVAAPVSKAGYCRMMWRAEGPGIQNRILPKISHYLGLGGEIGALAMHEGADNIRWYAGSKVPLVDLRWNIEQYYVPICTYIDSVREQFELDSRFLFYESLWQAQKTRRSFTIVEDEFCNLFDISRTFATREQEHGFINVISESYLLRDYMCANEVLFSNDPKAIPSIVPDYAQTERNFIIRMLALMAVSQVKEKVLSKELSIQGYETRLPYERFLSLVKKYTGIEDAGIRKIQNNERTRGQVFLDSAYVADKTFVESIFDSALRTAHFVVENEKTDTYMMGNRLMGQVEQSLLPGQFFCFDGRFYQVRRISPETGIVVRRAGDHLNGRFYYRQLRTYTCTQVKTESDARDLRGIRIQFITANIVVETDGYYAMEARHLLESASIVKLERKRCRELIKKDILKIEFPEIKDGVLFTLCDLFNELFRTIYPNDMDYIVATTSSYNRPSVSSEERELLRALVPTLEIAESDKAIYFIEDSNIDLGILVSIERNIQRFFEIITDYLDWYLDTGRERLDSHEAKSDILNKNEEKEENGDDQSSMDSETEKRPVCLRKDNKVHRGSDTNDQSFDIEGEDEDLFNSTKIKISSKYKNVEFLTYGFDKEPEWLKLQDTLKYLLSKKFDDSNIRRARKESNVSDMDYDPLQPGVHYCDFCGRVLVKGEYDVLKDGRERCKECGTSAVRTLKQFKSVYKETLSEMERIFDITINAPVKVRMVNAKKVNDSPSFNEFKPSPGFDIRVLGYATQRGKSFLLLVENGAPLWKMKSTLVHELTHIWQFINWDQHDNNPMYQSGRERDDIVEGMAVWTEVQYLMSMGKEEDSIRYRKNRELDKTEYGTGMVKYINKYPISKASSLKKRKTPFGKYPPL